MFYLQNNKIKSLPESIGALVNLKTLKLKSNRLNSLPQSITNLKAKLNYIALENNPLVEYGEGTNLGKTELKILVWCTIVFEDYYRTPTVPFSWISKQEVYEKLDSEALSWNRKRVKSIVLDWIPKHRMNGKEILRIWDEELKKYDTIENEGKAFIGRDFGSYIKTIYGIEETAFKGFEMYNSFVDKTKDLIEAIFMKLIEQLYNKNTIDCQAYIPKLCEAINWCPDRQLSTFQMIYNALYLKEKKTSLEKFIENEIAIYKNLIFVLTVTPDGGKRNIHLLNKWKQKMKEKLGLNTECNNVLGKIGNDQFKKSKGNLLEAFYTKFTPRYLIKKLKEEINRNQEILNQCGSFLIENEIEKRKRICRFEEDQIDMMNPKEITEQGIEEILIEMGILIRREIQTVL